MTGIIKAYFGDRGFGFLDRDVADNTLESYFFHIRDCKIKPQVGAHVQFELAEGPRGPKAVRISAIPLTAEEVIGRMDGVK